MRQLTIVTAAAVAAFFSSPAFAEQELAGHKVAQEFVGNTVKGEYRDCGPRKDFQEFYAENGEIRGHERDCGATGNWANYVGKWEVRDGKFCVSYTSERASGCWNYTAIQGGIRREAPDANMEDDLVILAGNPENL